MTALLVAQLVFVAIVYQFLRDIDCTSFGQQKVCDVVRDGMGRALALLAVLALAIPARRRSFGFLWRRPGDDLDGALIPRRSAGMALAGFAIALLPALAPTSAFEPMLPLFALMWAVGFGLMAVAVLAATGSARDWLAALRDAGPVMAGALLLALISPELTALAEHAWDWPALTRLTFDLVARLLAMVPGALYVETGTLILGFDEFYVEVGGPCSGLQGFALITLMLTVYLTLFRDRLRLPQALVLIPIGIAASFVLNVLRIAVLVWIGARISPQLAVDGFHSHAGWLTFTLLSFALIGVGHLVFARPVTGPTAAPLPPVRRDPAAAMLVPLIVMLLTGLAAATLVTVPALAYPARALAIAAALALFAPYWRGMDWRPGAVPLGAGLLVGALWLITATAPADPALTAGLDALSPAMHGLWVLSRLAGAILLVPLVEEAAFRGFLIGTLGGGRWGRLAMLVVGAALFALLHAHPVAFVAGLAFGLVFLRRMRLADAVWAHAAANLVTASAAALSGNWAVV
ncbi:exosortase E/protease, VPEID-CTERM system [Paracoccus luteus]|uniref:exosortase E/protease, VPEID-CTERM system n=1 Tax=Paracoccus luteus TaxID=2508543 RepID=UPI00106FCA49|nr:exosortase E/protease, VPEID-CTERM system [Paracoccus luteus]